MTTGSLRDLRAAGVARMDELLAERDLNRRRSDEYAWPLASGFDGWLGLRYISRPAEAVIEIEPRVGIRSAAVENMVRRLGGDGSRKPSLVSVWTAMWNLTPDRSFWLSRTVFTSITPIDAPIQEIVDAFETYGRPWAEKRASVPAIREELNGVLSLNTPALACRRIAVELVRGDRDTAWVALDAARTDAASRESDATAYLALVATWAKNLEAIIDGLDDRLYL